RHDQDRAVADSGRLDAREATHHLVRLDVGGDIEDRVSFPSQQRVADGSAHEIRLTAAGAEPLQHRQRRGGPRVRLEPGACLALPRLDIDLTGAAAKPLTNRFQPAYIHLETALGKESV